MAIAACGSSYDRCPRCCAGSAGAVGAGEKELWSLSLTHALTVLLGKMNTPMALTLRNRSPRLKSSAVFRPRFRGRTQLFSKCVFHHGALSSACVVAETSEGVWGNPRMDTVSRRKQKSVFQGIQKKVSIAYGAT